ncbi:MAG: TRAM domain-containing protein [Candidatus Nanohaloarchaea archaeon]
MAFGEDEGGGKPVEEGETYEVEIDDLGSKGDGIARVDNFVVFVPDTEVGERVEVEVNSVGSKFAFADVVERLGEAEGIEEEPEDAEETGSEEEPEEESGSGAGEVQEEETEEPEEELEAEEPSEGEGEGLEEAQEAFEDGPGDIEDQF